MAFLSHPTNRLLNRQVKDLPEDELWHIVHESTGADRQNIVIARGYTDMKFFCEYFFTNIEDGKPSGHIKDAFNKMHLDYFKAFKPELKSVREVWRAARGAAKTTMLTLLDPLHRICYGTEKFIVIFSSTTPLARIKAKDIYNEIVANENLANVFNLEFTTKRTSTERFTVQSRFGQCTVHAQGFFSQIRGIKMGAERPTFIIYDDVVHGERVFSEAQREKADRQFHTDIMNASQPETNHRFLGTTIHSKDLLSILANKPTWTTRTYKAIQKWPENMAHWGAWEKILNDSTRTREENLKEADKFYEDNKKLMNEGAKVLWPEREPLPYLMKERVSIGHRAFGAEKQLEPFLTGESLFQDIHWFSMEQSGEEFGFRIEKSGKFIPWEPSRFQKFYALDPATGERKTQTQKKTLSQSARLIGIKDIMTDCLYITQAFMDRKQPSKIIDEMYDLHNAHQFVRMGFEENLFREIFGAYILLAKEKWCKKNNVGLDTTFDLPCFSVWQTEKKEQRIYGCEPDITSGKMLFNKNIHPDFKTQLTDYPNCDHNDGLDALELLQKITNPENNLKALTIDDFAS